MESIVELDPLVEFLSAIKNPQTRRGYEADLKKFFDFLKIEGNLKTQSKFFSIQSLNDPKWATLQINNYILAAKERVEKGEIADSRVANLYKPIRLFCEENDIVLNWKKLARRVPKGRRAANDRAPTLDEIKAILGYPDRRIKPAVLIMESSGCRIGSFDYLNWGHIEKVEKKSVLVAAKIRIYAGTPDEYPSYITPECYQAIEDYILFRKSQGEKISKDSPVIRDLFHPDHLARGEPHLPVRLKSTGVKRLIEDALKGTGIRTTLEKSRKRHDFQTDHGFRKYFKTACERKMKSLHVEMLLGHTVGLGDNYYRPDEKELIEQYLLAVPDLSILDERQPIANAEDVEALKTRLDHLEASVKNKDAEIAKLHTSQEKVLKLLQEMSGAKKSNQTSAHQCR